MLNDLAVLGIVLAVLVALIAALVVHRIRKERRLATQDEIVVLLTSEWKGMVILLAWIAVFVLVGAFAPLLLKRGEFGHVGVVLSVLLLDLGLCGLGFTLCMQITRSWRRVGVLRYTPDHLSLTIDSCREWELDLRQQFELFEWSIVGPAEGQALQAVVVRQDETFGGFTYPLAITHQPFDNSPPVEGPRPMVGPDARVLHERLRAWRPTGGRAWL
jgi:hypothetical protein